MELRATTLAETLVASVIFLTCFIIATDSLVNITDNEAAADQLWKHWLLPHTS